MIQPDTENFHKNVIDVIRLETFSFLTLTDIHDVNGKRQY